MKGNTVVGNQKAILWIWGVGFAVAIIIVFAA